MAGSFEHLLPNLGEKPERGDGWRMIENMGDAYECVEELFWLVERHIGRARAVELLRTEFYPMSRGERQYDQHMIFVRFMMGSGD